MFADKCPYTSSSSRAAHWDRVEVHSATQHSFHSLAHWKNFVSKALKLESDFSPLVLIKRHWCILQIADQFFPTSLQKVLLFPHLQSNFLAWKNVFIEIFHLRNLIMMKNG